MKYKVLLTASVILLLALAVWIILDLFPDKEENEPNRYDYGMENLRKADTIPAYTEILPVALAVAEPRGLAADKTGKFAVAGNGGVEVFTPSGRTLNRFSIPWQAWCLTWLGNGNLAIGMEDHLEIWSPAGILVESREPPDSGSLITAVAEAGDLLYLADAGRKVVWQYDRTGALLNRIGVKDPARKIPGFVIPSPCFDLGISPAGDLWVVNPGRHQFEQYSPSGELKSTWGEASLTTEGFTGCCNPTHFAFLPDGSFITGEKGVERVKLYHPDGTFRCLVATPADFDEGTRGLDVAAGMEGRILVLDPSRKQVRVFLPNETP